MIMISEGRWKPHKKYLKICMELPSNLMGY